jgi:ubiquitin C-terminal hydrolase
MVVNRRLNPSNIHYRHQTRLVQVHRTILSQFVGTGQHDAQEVLSFLLDGIHEDLNRIVKKPYIEICGCIDVLMNRTRSAWKGNYLQRQSLVVDIFSGQLKVPVSV